MELDIEVKWTQEDIEKMLRARLEEEGLLLIPLPKVEKKVKRGKKKDDDDDADESAENKYFAWPRGGQVKVKARAVISPRAQRAVASGVTQDGTTPERMEPAVDDTPLDPAMLPDGTNLDALEAAARQRPMMRGESKEPPKPGKKVGR